MQFYVLRFVFQSYQNDTFLIMKGFAQCPFTIENIYAFSGSRTCSVCIRETGILFQKRTEKMKKKKKKKRKRTTLKFQSSG